MHGTFIRVLKRIIVEESVICQQNLLFFWEYVTHVATVLLGPLHPFIKFEKFFKSAQTSVFNFLPYPNNNFAMRKAHKQSILTFFFRAKIKIVFLVFELLFTVSKSPFVADLNLELSYFKNFCYTIKTRSFCDDVRTASYKQANYFPIFSKQSHGET